MRTKGRNSLTRETSTPSRLPNNRLSLLRRVQVVPLVMAAPPGTGSTSAKLKAHEGLAGDTQHGQNTLAVETHRMREGLPVCLSWARPRCNRPAPAVFPVRLLGARTVLACEAAASGCKLGCGLEAVLESRIRLQGLRDSGLMSAWPLHPTTCRLCTLTPLCTCQALLAPVGVPPTHRAPPPPGPSSPRFPPEAAGTVPFYWGLRSSTDAGDVGDFLDAPVPWPCPPTPAPGGAA